MGIEVFLVKDATREVYILGKGTWGFAGALRGGGEQERRAVDDGEQFLVDAGGAARISRELAEMWRDHNSDSMDEYMSWLAADVVRWSGSDLVRVTDDSRHDGWFDEVSREWEDGRTTGSRYAADHDGNDYRRPLRNIRG